MAITCTKRDMKKDIQNLIYTYYIQKLLKRNILLYN